MGEHHNVAPADEAYANDGKERKDGGPAQPSGASGPTFPPPIGVDHQALRDAGVANAYYGVDPNGEAKADAEDSADEDEDKDEPRKATHSRGQHAQRQAE